MLSKTEVLTGWYVLSKRVNINSHFGTKTKLLNLQPFSGQQDLKLQVARLTFTNKWLQNRPELPLNVLN